jgi:uncharacterized protein YcsI (UPF0317 family)
MNAQQCLSYKAGMTPRQIRELCRIGSFDGPTAGVALGYSQANLVVLPSAWATGFHRFCELNTRPCPLLEITKPGRFEPVQCAPGADVRTDLPRYRVYHDGMLTDEPTSILHYWPDDDEPYPDLVAFLIGCSFTFESALIDAGVPIRHIEEGRNVPMYRTNVACKPAGLFHGPMVVSMRPMTPQQAEIATRVTAAMPRVHGEPVHVGDPTALGIKDLSKPDYGDAVTIREGEVPVFWACGVTPLEAILQARPDIAIVHEPGHMFVTDLLDHDLRDFGAR